MPVRNLRTLAREKKCSAISVAPAARFLLSDREAKSSRPSERQSDAKRPELEPSWLLALLFRHLSQQPKVGRTCHQSNRFRASATKRGQFLATSGTKQPQTINPSLSAGIVRVEVSEIVPKLQLWLNYSIFQGAQVGKRRNQINDY